ncbi:MAG TPA: SBBP repeat-containing protein [Terriglobia bacterium]|nr:SBBP repeat-containing protein [Terriglobia bacterium]
MWALLCWATLLGHQSRVLKGAAPLISPANSRAAASAGVRTSYSLLPLSFELNQGQTDASVRFLARGQGYSLFLTADGAVLALQSSGGTRFPATAVDHGPRTTDIVRVRFLGANPNAVIAGREELPGKSNYFIGRDPRGWHTDVPTYAQVHYQEFYQGVDAIYYGRKGELEYDLVVGPRMDAGQVRFQVEGAQTARLNGAGDLVLATRGQEIVLRRPKAYQGTGADQREVAVRYVSRGKNEYGFEVGPYQRNERLTIDPVLSYATYLGGSGGDVAYGLALDPSGDAYVTGSTASINFPVRSAEQGTLAGSSDAFVAELNAAGTGLVYSTYIGGTQADVGSAIAIDTSGSAYIVGTTYSTNFPVTTGAFQTLYGGNGDENGNGDAFVAKLGPNGSSLVYASYLGGTGPDFGQGIAVDAAGNAYVTGSTQSFDFPTASPPGSSPLQIGNDNCTVVNQIETCTADAFVTKVNPTGTALVYSTYLGGSAANSGQAIAVDAQGDAYVTGYTNSTNFPTQSALQSANAGGSDAFVSELSPGGSSLVFSTYLGGSGQDQAFGLALGPSGDIYITGATQSANFPTTPNSFQTTYGLNGDAFVTRLAPGGTSIVFSTFIGGSQADQGNAIAVDSAGNSVVVGVTQSSDFPTLDASQNIIGLFGAGTCSSSSGVGTQICSDAFVARLNPSGGGLYSTYLGGSQNDFAQAVALDSTGTPYLAGGTTSSNFPAIVGALQGAFTGGGTLGNAFVAKMSATNAPAVALVPQEINFGNQTLNQASTIQTVTLINAGSALLEISDLTVGADFTETNNCGTTVPAGSGTCNINITYTPTSPGPTTQQVEITDNAAGGPHTITLTGNGVAQGAPALTFIPNKLTFSSQAVGTTSPVQTVVMENTSLVAITISSINISGDFAQTNNCGVLPNVINPGGSCTFNVSFTPSLGGSRPGGITVTDTATGSPQSVSLTGTGASPFTLSANSRTSTLLVGTTMTTFTITLSAPNSFTSTVSFACAGSATCSFFPPTITPGQSPSLTTTLTVSSLSYTTANPLNFSVTGTAGSFTSSVALSIFLQDFSLTAIPTLNSVQAGLTSSPYTVTVTPSNGFNGIVLLSCNLPGGLLAPPTSTSPAGTHNTTCNWSPSGLTFNTSVPQTARLTLTTSSQISTTSHGWPRRRWPGGPGRGPTTDLRRWLLVAGMIALLAGGVVAKRRFRGLHPQQARWLLVVVGVLLLTLTAMSCQDYGYNSVFPGPTTGTPTGNYSIPITGTLGNPPSPCGCGPNNDITRSIIINLTVSPTV